jgi:hypothetical protein
MRFEMKKIVFTLAIVSVALIGIRIFNRATIVSESSVLQEPAVLPAKSGELNSNTSLEPHPTPIRATSSELPEGPDELRDWARQHTQEALAWLQTAPAGETRDVVVEMVCAQVAEFDPAQAVSLAERYSGGCTNLLENLVHQWADQNEPAASDYAMTKPAGEERDRLLSRVAFARSKEDPADAAKLVAEWISPGEIQNEAAISVLHQWALRDPDAAAAWAKLFPASVLRERALNELAMAVLK